jgi:hypothetical protein
MANSSIFNFQIELIQASRSFFIIVESNGGTKFSSIFEAPVVGIHFSENKSLIQIGAHAKIVSLFEFNPSLFIKLNEFNLESYFSILFKKYSNTSFEVVFHDFISSIISIRLKFFILIII